MIESPLLKDIDEETFANLTKLGLVTVSNFESNEAIFNIGDKVESIGIVAAGSVVIENIDLWGHKSILAKIGAGGAFAETYALCKAPLQVRVVASTKSEICFLQMSKIMSESYRECNWRKTLMDNLLSVALRKTLTLSTRIFCTSPKSVRGRVLAFLSSESISNNSLTFNIQFSRQEMADYLNLDRTALSRVLSEMKAEGIIDYYKNTFKILSTEHFDI